jgi:hypothetical protein
LESCEWDVDDDRSLSSEGFGAHVEVHGGTCQECYDLNNRIAACLNACRGISTDDTEKTDVKALRNAVSIAMAAFTIYAEKHLEKGTPEGNKKSNTNLKLAQKMRAALENTPCPPMDAKETK